MEDISPTHTFVVLAYKESPYLEACTKSVLNQKYASQVVIATSTPNKYIQDIARKYSLRLVVRPAEERGKGAASDFDFALKSADTDLITVANHDEIYDYNYSSEIVDYYKTHTECGIIFSRYYDIKGNRAIYRSVNLTIKNILCLPLDVSIYAKPMKRLCLAFGDPICCPATTFVRGHFEFPVFESSMKAAFDYWAWERLSRTKYAFGYIKKPLMGHRIHEESITSKMINDHIRTKEELSILKNFWPKPVAAIISVLYRLSEISNK